MAHIVIDGAIDTQFIAQNFPERYALKAQDSTLSVEAIAENYWQLHLWFGLNEQRRIRSTHFGRGHLIFLSGWLRLPARNCFTAAATERATLRTSSCTAVSLSSASWLL